MKTRTTQFIKFGVAILAVLSLAACRKDNDETPFAEVSDGVFVLNEGNYNASNSSISYYQSVDGKVISDVYAAANSSATSPASLGNTGQDIKMYGSKTYITVHGSNFLTVIDTKTSKLIKSLDLRNPAPAQPRYLEAANGKIFFSAYDDHVYVVDTATLAVQKSIRVGQDPEQMAIVGNKLYVVNSGGLNWGVFDNTVSVIDLNTLTEIKKITVQINCYQIAADKYGDVYVTCRGYGTVPENVYRINTSTDAVTPLNIPATAIAIHNDIAYLYNSPYGGAKTYTTLNVKTETVGDSFIKDGTSASIVEPYGIGVDPLSGDIYIGDAKDFQNEGEVHCYSADGKKKFSFKAGVSPSRFAFYKK